jgi:hypothetical protein
MLGVAAVAAMVPVLVKRIGSDTDRSTNNQVAGQAFTIVAGLHAVLLAFVLISLFDAVSTARTGSNVEANSLVAVSWAAESLQQPTPTKVSQTVSAYSNTVVNKEWPQMSNDGKVDGAAGWQQLDELRQTIAASQTTAGDDWQASRKAAATDQVWAAYQARQTRLDAAARNGVSSVVWFALLLGSVMSMTLIYVHGGPNVRSHAIISGVLAAAITLLLFAIYQLQNPYSGGAAVGPDAFRMVLDRLG